MKNLLTTKSTEWLQIWLG